MTFLSSYQFASKFEYYSANLILAHLNSICEAGSSKLVTIKAYLLRNDQRNSNKDCG